MVATWAVTGLLPWDHHSMVHTHRTSIRTMARQARASVDGREHANSMETSDQNKNIIIMCHP
jgi:hypothetical protein